VVYHDSKVIFVAIISTTSQGWDSVVLVTVKIIRPLKRICLPLGCVNDAKKIAKLHTHSHPFPPAYWAKLTGFW